MSHLEDFVKMTMLIDEDDLSPEMVSTLYLASIAKSMASIADDLHEINRKNQYEKKEKL